MSASPARRPAWDLLAGRRRVLRGFDALVLLALSGAAYWARRGTLPTDGVWFDDSWVAAGAIHGRPRGLLSVGSGHPGFTAVLMAADRAGANLSQLGLPSLIAGILGPALLYLMLRSLGFARSISLFVGAVLVVAWVHVLYSGRIKGYTLDTILVALIAAVLPRLAGRHWRWPTALAWTVGAVVVGTSSGYVLVATAVAGLVLVLHPASDRMLRLVAVGAQGLAQGTYFLVAQAKTDLAGIEEVMEGAYDGHMTFSWNPVTLGGEVLTHIARIAEVFPGGPDGTNALLGAIACGGLLLGALRERGRSEALAARFLLLLVVLAAVGSLLDRFPFGTTNVRGQFTVGGRHTLWLVPAFAVGLAVVLQRLREVIARHRAAVVGMDGLFGLAAVAVVVAGYQPALPAPLPGSRSAATFVDQSVGPDDVVIVQTTSTFSYAINTPTPVVLRATPDHQVGYAPVFLDPKVHNLGPWSVDEALPGDVPGWVEDADRVLVIGDGPLALGGLDQMGPILEPLGFNQDRRSFMWSTVDVWTR